MSFVVIGAFAPQSVDETPPAGAAQLPLLLNPQPLGVPVANPAVAFQDHSPDLLLQWLDHAYEGGELTLHEAVSLAFADASNSNFSLTDHTPAAVVFTDHTPD